MKKRDKVLLLALVLFIQVFSAICTVRVLASGPGSAAFNTVCIVMFLVGVPTVLVFQICAIIHMDKWLPCVIGGLMKVKLDTIPSFNFDHTKLKKGLYVGGKMKIFGNVITTFDVRMMRPVQKPEDPVIDMGGLHTMEHLIATYMRNDAQWKDRVVYVGPMGCRTGNYILLAGDLEVEDIRNFFIKTFRFIVNFQGEIPGATVKGCGNYLEHDLEECRKICVDYLNVLENLTEETTTYPN